MSPLLLKNADGSELPAKHADLQEIRPGPERCPVRVAPAELARRRAAESRLLELAPPHLEWMADMLADLSPVVYLVDADGIVLWSAAPSPELLRQAEAEPGCAWSEAAVGPNAAGGALAAGRPVLAVGSLQPEPSWRAFTALAAPLRGPDGRRVGAVVASAPHGSARPERLALASYAAFAIERQWIAQERRTARPGELSSASDEDGRIRRLLDAAPDALVVMRTDGTIVFANAQVEALFGYGKDEVLGRPVEFLVPERLRALCEAHRDESLRSPRGRGFDLLARRKDGRELPVEISLSPLRAREGLLVSAAIRDISARRQADRRLEIRDAVSRALAESPTFAEAAPRILQAVVEGLGWDTGGAWLLDDDGRALRCAHLWVRPSIEECAFVRASRTCILKPGEGLPGVVCESGLPRLVPDVTTDARFLRGPLAAEAGLGSAFGFPIVLEGRVLGMVEFLSARPIETDEETLQLLASFGSQVGQFLERRRVEQEMRLLNAELEARVQERTRALEESLREMGTFTYTVAHDLRAPLRALHGFSDLLVRDYLERPLDADGRDYLQRIRAAAARMDALILDLLNYSRVGQDQIPLEAVDVRRLTESLLKHMEGELEDRGAEASIEGPSLLARANPFLLEQALANLVSNAVKFVAPAVAPRVKVVVEPRDGRVRVKVVDNGIGIAPEHHERVFGIFQQLNRREDYPGTGIGLALVRRATEKMGGTSGVESAPGVGSVFWLELPQVDPKS